MLEDDAMIQDRATAAVVVVLIVELIGAGLYLRRSGPSAGILVRSSSAAGYRQTQRLLEEKGVSPWDPLRLAPGGAANDFAPALAVITSAGFRATRYVLSDVTLRLFVTYVPLAIFVLWLASLVRLLAGLVDLWTALGCAALLAVMPASIELTSFGAYSDDPLGHWLLFMASCLLLRSAAGLSRWRWSAVGVAVLALAWRPFPLLLPAAAAVVAGASRWGAAKSGVRGLTAIGLGLLAAEAVARVATGGAYSPIEVLGESLARWWRPGAADAVEALTRPQAAIDRLTGLYRYFGLLGTGLFSIGWLRVLTKEPEPIGVGAAGLAATGMACIGSASGRFAALTLSLPLIGLGLESLLYPQEAFDALRRWIVRVAAAVDRLRAAPVCSRARPALVSALMVTLLLGTLRATIRLADPQPVLRLEDPERILLRGVRGVLELDLENRGGPSSGEGPSFAGVHVEIQNAEVHAVRANTGDGRDVIVFPNPARTGEVRSFEVRRPSLDPGDRLRVRFSVTPLDQPLRIYYRGWIATRCAELRCRRPIPAGETEGAPCVLPVGPKADPPQPPRCFTAP